MCLITNVGSSALTPPHPCCHCYQRISPNLISYLAIVHRARSRPGNISTVLLVSGTLHSLPIPHLDFPSRRSSRPPLRPSVYHHLACPPSLPSTKTTRRASSILKVWRTRAYAHDDLPAPSGRLSATAPAIAIRLGAVAETRTAPANPLTAVYTAVARPQDGELQRFDTRRWGCRRPGPIWQRIEEARVEAQARAGQRRHHPRGLLGVSPDSRPLIRQQAVYPVAHDGHGRCFGTWRYEPPCVAMSHGRQRRGTPTNAPEASTIRRSRVSSETNDYHPSDQEGCEAQAIRSRNPRRRPSVFKNGKGRTSG